MANEPRRLILYAIATTAAAAILLWTLYEVRAQLLIIYVSALFATGLGPVVRFIERQRVMPIGTRRMPRAAAILGIYATVLMLLGTLVAVSLPPLIAQAGQLWQDLPHRIDVIRLQLVAWALIPADLTVGNVMQRLPPGSADVVTTAFLAVLRVAGGLFGFVSILLLTFYFLVESHGVFDVFVRLFPRQRRGRVAEVSERVAVKISAWLGGQVLLGFIIGLTSAIGLAVLGVPYFFVLAVICGIGEMIPMVGPLLSAIPAVAVAFTVSPGLALAVAVFFFLQQAVENNVLVPRVMGQQVGLSAVTVIIALSIGSELLGLVGALLAVPTAAIIQVLVEELLLDPKEA